MHNLLIDFVTRELLSRRANVPLEADDDLLGGGLVNSIGIMRLVHFVENRYGLEIPLDDITIENFMTINTITRYLENRLESNGQPADG